MGDRTWEDVAALWMATFGEAPPIYCEPSLLLDILVRSLASPLPYQPGTRHGSVEIARTGQDTHIARMPMAVDG